jgi:hypothetical protein
MRRAAPLLVLALTACSSASSSTGPSDDASTSDTSVDATTDDASTTDTAADSTAADAPSPDAPADLGTDAPAPTFDQKRRAFASALGASHAGHFLVGLGNDGTNSGNDPAYSFGVTLDLHDHYLVGLSTEGGWPTWNSAPDYAGKRIAEGKSHGVVTMLTQYAMAAHGDGNVAGSVGDAAYMKVYFKDYLQLLDTIAKAGGPVVIHHEPDFWGYVQQAAITAGGGPEKVVAKVSALAAIGVNDCKTLPDDARGFGQCVLKLTRARAPNALIGFHASAWSTKRDCTGNTDTTLDVAAEAAKTVAFFKAIGLDGADFVATDPSDRDAGCYEVGYASGGKTICDVRSNVYWDETNTKLPNFAQASKWAKAISQGLGLPIVWWQIPLGVPSTTKGGTADHFRDNRVHYFFSHVGELIAAGGVGMVFGGGAGGQTSTSTDGGQYSNAVKAYFASPVALP